jgi:hypothetical protein
MSNVNFRPAFPVGFLVRGYTPLAPLKGGIMEYDFLLRGDNGI